MRRAVVKNSDMPEEMQQDAVDSATTALGNFDIEKDIAAYIKDEFDKKYGPKWHCSVGRNFGSYVPLRHRDKALHLLLPGTGGGAVIQIREEEQERRQSQKSSVLIMLR